MSAYLALVPEDVDLAEFWSKYYGQVLGAQPEVLRAIYAASPAHLLARARVAEAERVVDAGCGFGILGLMCADLPAHIIGVGREGELLGGARHFRPEGDFRSGSLAALPLEAGEVDTYVGISALECTDEPLSVSLAEARRVLAPGGRLFVVGLRLPPLLGLRARAKYSCTLGDIEVERAGGPETVAEGRAIAVFHPRQHWIDAAKAAGFEQVSVRGCDALAGLSFAPEVPSPFRFLGRRRSEATAMRLARGAPLSWLDRMWVEDPEYAPASAMGLLRRVWSYWNVLEARVPGVRTGASRRN